MALRFCCGFGIGVLTALTFYTTLMFTYRRVGEAIHEDVYGTWVTDGQFAQ